MRHVDIVIIGGGSAGMAAAAAAYEQGIRNLLIIERNNYLGGILRQCIHNGFGLHRFHEDLTGVEYAGRYIDKIMEYHIPYILETFVLSISDTLEICAMNPFEGLIMIQPKAVILAMGCRERTRGTLLIPGVRCAGILTAGTAQKYLNIEGYLPGRRVVILGSGDIGLIMARQFVIEGVAVEAVVEIMPYSSGLARNIAQCLDDFNIPLYYNSTVTDINGLGRVESVTVSQVDEKRRPVSGTEKVIRCDTLLISAGLIPENELTKDSGIEISPVTRGAVVTDDLQTSRAGVFSCGNVLHVHDLVDYVSAESENAGHNAALYVRGKLNPVSHVDGVVVRDGAGVNGAVPQYIRRTGERDTIRIMFRPKNVYKNCHVCVDIDGGCVKKVKKMILTPGEMSEIEIKRDLLAHCSGSLTLRVEV
jgi:NADPH-dependent 2,4-dienoyl-CoA reductase/sulfur reductase-like enzyme